MANKTRLMKEIEHQHGLPLLDLLRLQYESGATDEAIAAALGISRITLQTWIWRLGAERVTTIRVRSEPVTNP